MTLFWCKFMMQIVQNECLVSKIFFAFNFKYFPAYKEFRHPGFCEPPVTPPNFSFNSKGLECYNSVT